MTTDSPTTSPRNNNPQTNASKYDTPSQQIPQIPIEFVSQEEMGLIEAAFSLAASAIARRSPIISVPPPSSSFSLLSSRSLSNISGFSSSFPPSLSVSACGDVEDLGRVKSPNKKKSKMVFEPLLYRFRKKGLYVTDITSTEWCEKQMEFGLVYGRPESTSAMKAGIARHAKLEEEVTRKVEVRVETSEDIWALKFLNFIICANQVMFEKLTREVPVVGLVQGVWVVGVIDELRMPVTGDRSELILVDTKTRRQPSIPAEPQRRNGRLQLMCYKYLWDMMVSNSFPSEQFLNHYSLDAEQPLSDQIKMRTADSGIPAETLGEVMNYLKSVCLTLPTAHDQLILRYELQEDNSLIGEDDFTYDNDWLKDQIQGCLEFWRGEREAKYVPENELWKCRYCKFVDACPSQTEANTESSLQRKQK